MVSSRTVGIIGGSGMLGRAISQALLDGKVLQEPDLWISNRSGGNAGFENHPQINFTNSNKQLCEACDIIIFSVPPARASDIQIHVPDRLVISVMAGVSIDELRNLTGAQRIIRAMSSPAAALGLAYTPWVATPQVDAADRTRVVELFSACGETDEINDETQLDHFTAMTGPVPGFVAFYAQCMVDYALKAGISPDIADRAIRQLFLSSGTMLANGKATPAQHVQEMIDYAGTTAAGLVAMEKSPISNAIAQALDVAVEKARNIR